MVPGLMIIVCYPVHSESSVCCAQRSNDSCYPVLSHSLNISLISGGYSGDDGGGGDGGTAVLWVDYVVVSGRNYYSL